MVLLTVGLAKEDQYDYCCTGNSSSSSVAIEHILNGREEGNRNQIFDDNTMTMFNSSGDDNDDNDNNNEDDDKNNNCIINGNATTATTSKSECQNKQQAVQDTASSSTPNEDDIATGGSSTSNSSSSSSLEEDDDDALIPEVDMSNDRRQIINHYTSNNEETSSIRYDLHSQSTKEILMTFWIGPILMIFSIALIIVPCFWQVVINLSCYTIGCCILFIVGTGFTCYVMFQLIKKDVIIPLFNHVEETLNNIVLDDMLQQTIQTSFISTISISSLITLYVLPISKECRGQLLDSIVGDVCPIHGIDNTTHCNCSNKILPSDILLRKGGLIHFLRCCLKTTTTTKNQQTIADENINDFLLSDEGKGNDERLLIGPNVNNVATTTTTTTAAAAEHDDMVWNNVVTRSGINTAITDSSGTMTFPTTSSMASIDNGTSTTTTTINEALIRVMMECTKTMLYPLYTNVKSEIHKQPLKVFVVASMYVGIKYKRNLYRNVIMKNNNVMRNILYAVSRSCKIPVGVNTAAAMAAVVAISSAMTYNCKKEHQQQDLHNNLTNTEHNAKYNTTVIDNRRRRRSQSLVEGSTLNNEIVGSINTSCQLEEDEKDNYEPGSPTDSMPLLQAHAQSSTFLTLQQQHQEQEQQEVSTVLPSSLLSFALKSTCGHNQTISKCLSVVEKLSNLITNIQKGKTIRRWSKQFILLLLTFAIATRQRKKMLSYK